MTEQPSPEQAVRRWCAECGEQGVPVGSNLCELCGERNIEPFKEGWDESD